MTQVHFENRVIGFEEKNIPDQRHDQFPILSVVESKKSQSPNHKVPISQSPLITKQVTGIETEY